MFTQVINYQRQQHEKENIINSNDVPGCNDSFGTNPYRISDRVHLECHLSATLGAILSAILGAILSAILGAILSATLSAIT